MALYTYAEYAAFLDAEIIVKIGVVKLYVG
jgi:hypothetical protein